LHYREIQPPAPLDRYLESIWLLAGTPSADEISPQRILPDGCIEVIFHFGDRFAQRDAVGAAHPQPREIVVGQMDGPMFVGPTGRTQILGLRFRPAGAYPLFRIPLSELHGGVVEPEAVLGDFRREVLARVNPRSPVSEQVSAVSRILQQRLASAGDPDPTAEAVCEEILCDPARASVSALALAAGLSSRQLERKFHRHVGLEPKHFCRIQRFQRVFRAVEQLGGASWAQVAVERGFYDQAHFIKECRQFSGLTPPALFGQLSPITEQFTRKNR
jgi:AraC-like DNA-binding protein